jgi:hypothetical protein
MNLLNLGSGRFCIAKIFQVTHNPRCSDNIHDWDVEYEVAVLTGIEIGGKCDEGLKVFKQKSILYRRPDYGILGVL